MRERKKRVRYVTPSYRESGHAEYGDPSDHGFPSFEEAPYHGFSFVHMVRISRRENVGDLFAFGDRSFKLRTDHVRDAILVENERTGEHLFIPRKSIFMFFWSLLPKFHITQTWNHWEEQEAGSVAHALESRHSRSAALDTDAEFRKRGGNPSHSSAFKGTYGLRRDMKTNRILAVNPHRNIAA